MNTSRMRNMTLRTIRERLNLSQEEFAAALRDAGVRLGEPNGATKRLVQRWESGVSASARPVYRRALQEVTGLAYRDLGFAGPAGATAWRESDEWGTELAGPPGLLGSWPETYFPGRGERVGTQFLEWIAARTVRLRRLDDFLGGADTVDLYFGEVRRTALVLRHARYSEHVGRELARTLAQQAQQAGWAAFDTGAHAHADWLFRYSLDAAQEAGDQALAGNALALRGYLRTQTGQAGGMLASEAYEVAGAAAPPAVRALLAQRMGWAYAVAGLRGAAERALGAAREHLIERETQPVPDWAAWADEREQRIIEGRCWVELARPERAVEVLESALAEYGADRVRNKSLFLTWLALAYLGIHEIEAAAATTTRVLDTAAHLASPRLARRLVSLTQRFEPHRNLPQVRELLAREIDAPGMVAFPNTALPQRIHIAHSHPQ